MKPWGIVALATGVVIAAALGALLIVLAVQAPQEPEPAGPPPATSTPAGPEAAVPDAPKPTPMAFTREGDAGKVAVAVERVARPGNAQVAVAPRNGGRWICVLVNGRERYVELDQGLRADDFPWIGKGGFQPPPPQLARTGTSIYRSVAKRAMGYDAERGDRILIVVCPRDQWPQLALRWPAPSARRATPAD